MVLYGNPIYGDKAKEEIIPYVIRKLPNAQYIDNTSISKALRKKAEDLE